jgi:hypothetical protein
MRVADRPLPPIELHDDPRLDRWPMRPVIAIAGARDVAEWDDDPLEVWDDPMLEWDQDLVPGFIDATCHVQGVETETGNPDDHGQFSAGAAVIQLDNSSGDWSQYNFDGSLSGRGPGYELAIWARYRDTGDSWWMFRGTISRWDDLGDIVEVEAFDAFSDLAQPIGTYTPGANGQNPADRLLAILAAAGSTGIPHDFATGDVTLTAQETDAAPLEEMEAVTGSDGGALFVDVDGTLRSTRRTWRAGRADQTGVPVVAANVCTADNVVWDAVLSTNDSGIADTVILENIAKLRAQSPAGPIGRFVFTETDQQWTTQVEGDTLAAFQYSAQQGARVNVDGFDLYLFDPDQPDLYRAVEWRLFDLLRFLHNYHAADGGLARLDVNTIISTIAHTIVPDGNWVMSVATTKAVGSNQILVWNPPGDPYVWNTPGAVWGYA